MAHVLNKSKDFSSGIKSETSKKAKKPQKILKKNANKRNNDKSTRADSFGRLGKCTFCGVRGGINHVGACNRRQCRFCFKRFNNHQGVKAHTASSP